VKGVAHFANFRLAGTISAMVRNILMRRHFFILLLVIAAATLATLAVAQEDDAPEEVPIEIPREEAPDIFGPLTEVWVPIELEPIPDPSLAPAAHGSDVCNLNEDNLALRTFGTAGDLITVNDMTTAGTDPDLSSCVWGTMQDPRGFRTVWYRFTAPVSGRLVITTGFNPADFDDSYDTVVALYRSPTRNCADLVLMACNDDFEGFLSQTSLFVNEGVTYFVEVADWHFAVQSAATLRLAVVLEEGESFWDKTDVSAEDALTRHIVVTDGRFIYVIAGERPDPNNPPFVIRDAITRRFDPQTGDWKTLYPMPEGHGYTRTDGAYLNGKIYIPSGWVGNNSAYAGTHWVLDPNAGPFGTWSQTLDAPWPNGNPYAWAQAAASPTDNGYFLTGGLLSGEPNPSFPADAEPTDRLLFFTPGAGGNNPFWNANLPNMPRARYAHVADLLNTPQGRRVCVAGGVGKISADQATVLRSADCYDVAGGAWTSISPPNFARFGAGSVVGPDGRWYVFGGLDAFFLPVTVTEVYDPNNNTWEALDSRYSLRNPGRAWPRGAVVDSNLWVFYGEIAQQVTDLGWVYRVVPLIERLPLPQGRTLVPFTFNENMAVEPNNVMADAVPIALDQTVSGRFEEPDDFFDFYRFTVTEPGVYAAYVTGIPSVNNYDVYIYSANKFQVGDGRAVGNLDETAVTLPITPGDYYVAVLRATGPADPDDTYELVVRKRE
jgi:hypothetical protein